MGLPFSAALSVPHRARRINQTFLSLLASATKDWGPSLQKYQLVDCLDIQSTVVQISIGDLRMILDPLD
jgi:hypothetical protein